MDLTVTKAADPNLEGKRPTDAASQMVKLYAEYNLPFLRALTLTGGVFWIGDQAVDTANTTKVPSYLLGDVGARYELRAFDRSFMLRVYASNVADKNYWLGSSVVGAPRTVMFSMTARLW
ncbi:MAG: hypothetical protein OJF50_006039 [Nitrospira sp.]|nr:hypothetical protein [Nitrospira sp.]